jgi:hypothetical protein
MDNQMNLKDRNLRYALLKAFTEAIAAELDAEKATHKADLTARYDTEGVKSFDVKLPDGTKVAAISLAIPKASTEVTDTDALLKWAEANAPHLVEVTEHPAVAEHLVLVPAVEAWTEKVLDTKLVAELLTHVKPVERTGGPVVDTDTGQIVDGVTYTPEGPPKSFSVRYTDDGREDLGRAYRSGDLSFLVGGTPLPAIEAADQ